MLTVVFSTCFLSLAKCIYAILDPFSPPTEPTLTKEDFGVGLIPELTQNLSPDQIPEMFAGQIPLHDENNTVYFFWKMSRKQNPPATKKKTIFWLNGGPGCLSIVGALLEIGPFRVNDRNEVVGNIASWDKKADLVFVDQPANTGFSYSDGFNTELYQLLKSFMLLLEEYFRVFPEDANNDITLAGESYGGQYVPYIGKQILDHNRNSEQKIKVTGLLIGNGWISPAEQGLSYLSYSETVGIVNPSNPQWDKILSAQKQCEMVYSEHRNPFGNVLRVCRDVLLLVINATTVQLGQGHAQCHNIYDYSLQELFPECGVDWPPDFARLESLVNQEEFKKKLNIKYSRNGGNGANWVACSPLVSGHLQPKRSVAAITYFPELLLNMKVVLYHGNRDFVCNCLGAEKMISNLEWGGETGFSKSSPKYIWTHGGAVAGEVRHDRNLTFVNVFGGSHYVAFENAGPSQGLVDLLYGDYDTMGGKNGGFEVMTYPG